MTQASIMRDVWDPLGLHLNQKDLKSGKKWPSYGHITNGRLRDTSEYHAVCMGSIRASFEPKRSKSGKKCTAKSIDIERHRNAPEIWLVLRVGFDPTGCFLCGDNLFKLANWL